MKLFQPIVLFGFLILMFLLGCNEKKEPQKPNVIFVFADQWCAQDVGYNGNKIVKTPNINKLAAESIVFFNAVSGCSAGYLYQASLLTGQYPLAHGVFYNNIPLNPNANSIAKVYKRAGYETGYIGEWHLNGHQPGEKTFGEYFNFMPEAQKQGFDFWQVLECTHTDNNSFYYENLPQKLKWQKCDAVAQTKSAVGYIKEKAKGKNPFLLMLSWGQPHALYKTAPERYRKMYSPEDIKIRPNVPDRLRKKAKRDIAGCYAHITALDDCMKELLEAVDQSGIEGNTIFVFTSGHGDMLYLQGSTKQQQPWDESLLVPFLLRYPEKLGKKQKQVEEPINTPDIMPTLLGLSGIDILGSVEGTDFSKIISKKKEAVNEAVLIQGSGSFYQWNYGKNGRGYRGVRTKRFTYVCDLNGPWLLYDNLIYSFQVII